MARPRSEGYELWRLSKLVLMDILLSTSLIPCWSSVHSKFKHYEVLKADDLQLEREKRDAINKFHERRRLSFTAFQTRFSIHLTPGIDILHVDAVVRGVDENGKEKPFTVDRNSFYTGTVDGNPNYQVDATTIEGGLWIAHIRTPHEFYGVEPLRFYDSSVGHRDMIVYRGRDIRSNNNTFGKKACRGFTSKTIISSETGTKETIGGADSDEKNIWKDASRHHGRRMGTIKNSNSGKIPYSYNGKGKGRKSPTPRQHSAVTTTIPTSQMKVPVRVSESGMVPGRIDLIRNDSGTSIVNGIKLGVPRTSNQRGRSGHERIRGRRANAKKATECSVIAVADYNLFKGLGNHNMASTVGMLLIAYQNADRMFRYTQFDGQGTGYGLVVKKVLIHTNYSNHGYNIDAPRNDARSLLVRMTHFMEFSLYCVAHLTTQSDLGNDMGITFTPNGPLSETGICSPLSLLQNRVTNVGLSSFIHRGTPHTVETYSLLLAHEIGHSFGAHHDPEFRGHFCSPLDRDGGPYLMHAYMYPRIENGNYDKFSICSSKEIANLLKDRLHICFTTKDSSEELCGNGVIEASEDCDSGHANFYRDPCCSDNCRFEPHAVCSPQGQPCCTNRCQVAPPWQECYNRDLGPNPCHYTSFCLGEDSTTCPRPLAKPDGTPCSNGGECYLGQCIPHCKLQGMRDVPVRKLRRCLCLGNKRNMCQLCCVDMHDLKRRCKPIGRTLTNGSRCREGHCLNGMCEPHQVPIDNVVTLAEALFRTSMSSTVEIPGLEKLMSVLLAVSLVFNRHALCHFIMRLW